MNKFKVGDAVALITQSWNAQFVVTKIAGDKVVVQSWNDYGLWGRMFPVRTYTLHAAMLQLPERDEMLKGRAAYPTHAGQVSLTDTMSTMQYDAVDEAVKPA
jgi:hypothetical protein